MKILALGDIHGRTIWKDIIEKEAPDLVVFLGDYVSSHENVSANQQVSNLLEILKYKETNPERVILLRGNHDLQHLGYYWAECSGLVKKVLCEMGQIRSRFLDNTQWIYVHEGIIFSHAGVSQVWMDQSLMPYLVEALGLQYDDSTIDGEILLEKINDVEPCEIFGFIPNRLSDSYGESTTQPPVWIRPYSLCGCAIEGYTQVVGHSPVQQITCFRTEPGDDTVWLCDCLGNGQYLVIEDGKFSTKTHDDFIKR